MKMTFIGVSGGSVTAESPSSSVLFEHEGRKLLVDIGSGVMMELVRMGAIDGIDDIIITHFHADHDADSVIAIHDRLIKTQLGLPVKPLTFWTPEDGKQRELRWEGYSDVRTVKAGDRLKIAGFDVEFFSSVHPVPCLSVKVSAGGSTVYCTSDGAWRPGLRDDIGDSDIVVAECSLYRDVDGAPMGHMNAEDAAVLRSEIKADMLYLTHLPIYGNRDELLAPAREKGLTGIGLAEKGLSVKLRERKEC